MKFRHFSLMVELNLVKNEQFQKASLVHFAHKRGSLGLSSPSCKAKRGLSIRLRDKLAGKASESMQANRSL